MTARVCCSLTAVLLCLSVYLSTIDAKRRVKIKGTIRLDKGWLPARPSLSDVGPGATAPVAPPKGWPWSPAEKPGVCPSNDPRYCFRSKNRCFHDSNCPDDLKCCSDGCGRQCMAPNRAEKPGVCPSNDLRYCFRSENRCFHDSNCPDDLKCCSDSCGRQCMAPNREKSRPGPLSSSTVVTPHLTLPKLLRGTRDR